MANKYIVSDSDPMSSTDGNNLRVGDLWSTSAGMVKKLVSTDPWTWQIVANPVQSIDWANVTGKPSTYAPSAHTNSEAQIIPSLVVVSYAAVPTFDLSLGKKFKITLAGNVTDQAFTNAVAGDEITIIIVQNNLGLNTWVWNANFLGAIAVSTVANKRTAQRAIYDGSIWVCPALGLAGL